MNVIDEIGLAKAVKHLCQIDPHLESVVNKYGPPPLWAREPGFPTLIHIILEQQVSLASAKACFDKLNLRLPTLTPETFLSLTDKDLSELGFSRQKSRYSRILATAIIEQKLKLDGLNHLADEQVFSKLTALTGIGPWTANIYLLMALGRQDIWPTGDLALVVAIQKLFDLETRPNVEAFLRYGEKWQPYRAVAARILWHYYLST